MSSIWCWSFQCHIDIPCTFSEERLLKKGKRLWLLSIRRTPKHKTLNVLLEDYRLWSWTISLFTNINKNMNSFLFKVWDSTTLSRLGWWQCCLRNIWSQRKRRHIWTGVLTIWFSLLCTGIEHFKIIYKCIP